MATDPIAPVDTGLPPQDDAVVTEEGHAEETFSGKTVSIAAVLAEKPAEGSTEKKAPPAKVTPDAPGAAQKPKPAERTFTQTEFNRILGERLAEERAKPAYQYGQAAIAARAKRDGVTEAEAFARIRTEENARIAKEYAENPERAYSDMLNGTFNPYAQQPQQQPKPQQQTEYRYTSDNVAESLESMNASGTLPAGFTAESVTEEFVIDAMTNGTEAALFRWMMAKPNRVVTRESVASEMERRKNIPRTMQSGGGNVATRSASPKQMSKEDFAKLDAEIEKGNRSGFSVRLEE